MKQLIHVLSLTDSLETFGGRALNDNLVPRVFSLGQGKDPGNVVGLNKLELPSAAPRTVLILVEGRKGRAGEGEEEILWHDSRAEK